MSENRWQTYFKQTATATPGRGAMSMAGYAHRLQWNENPYDFPDDLKAEVLQRYAKHAWGRYPTEFRPRALTEAIAAHADVAPENVILGAGSSALIQTVLTALLRPGDHLVTPSPTFLLYRREALSLGAELHQVPATAESGFALPVDDLIVCARTNEAKAIALCAPNNPTGTVYAADDLRRLADESGALLIVDEAYREFCGQDLRPLLDEYENVILLRTLSKAYAMAGLRVGYGLAAPAIIAAVDKQNLPFPISTFSALAATVALGQSTRFLQQVDAIIAERQRMAAVLEALGGIRVYPSGTNFLLLQFERSPEPLFRRLKEERDLLVSDVGGYPELTNCLRISVGLPEENDTVLQVVREEEDKAQAEGKD